MNYLGSSDEDGSDETRSVDSEAEAKLEPAQQRVSSNISPAHLMAYREGARVRDAAEEEGRNLVNDVCQPFSDDWDSLLAEISSEVDAGEQHDAASNAPDNVFRRAPGAKRESGHAFDATPHTTERQTRHVPAPLGNHPSTVSMRVY